MRGKKQSAASVTEPDKLTKSMRKIYTRAEERAQKAFKGNQGRGTEGEISYLSSDVKYQQAVADIAEAEKANHGVYNTLIAALIKKVDNPKRNIEWYSDDLGRDGKNPRGWVRGCNLEKFAKAVVTPFLIHNHFASAPASIKSQVIPNVLLKWPRKAWNRDFPGRKDIKGKHASEAFFEIIEQVQEKGVSPELYLEDLFTCSAYRKLERQKERPAVKEDFDMSAREALSIIDRHIYFDYSCNGKHTAKNTSKLPVLAVWSYYKCVADHSSGNVRLDMYNPHTATDSTDSPGDVVVRDGSGLVQECVDLKACGAGAKLTCDDVRSAFDRKILPAVLKAWRNGDRCLRNGYYFVYTDKPAFEEMVKINDFARKAFRDCGVDIQVLSMDDFLANRLPYIENRGEFLANYYGEVQLDRHGELLNSHQKKLEEIYREEHILKDDDKDESFGNESANKDAVSRDSVKSISISDNYSDEISSMMDSIDRMFDEEDLEK